MASHQGLRQRDSHATRNSSHAGARDKCREKTYHELSISLGLPLKSVLHLATQQHVHYAESQLADDLCLEVWERMIRIRVLPAQWDVDSPEEVNTTGLKNI